MKKLILIFALLVSINSFSQYDQGKEVILEGEVVVNFVSHEYVSITFTSTRKTYAVKQVREQFEEAKEYYVLMKKVDKKGTRATGELLYQPFKTSKQNFRDLQKAKDSISMMIKTIKL